MKSDENAGGEAHYYSLWLMPETNALRALKGQIDKLASMYKTAVFEPHVTLLGNIAGYENVLVEKTRTLSSGIKTMELRSDSVGHSDEYTRSLFARINMASDIMDAYNAAIDILGVSNNGFSPHLSLMYSNMPLEKKAEAAALLEKGALDVLKKFRVDRLCLYATWGEVTRWREIAGFGLAVP